MSEYIYGTDGQENHWLTDEEIVRCRDCIYMSDECLTTAWCNENCREVRPRDFCAWGERKMDK